MNGVPINGVSVLDNKTIGSKIQGKEMCKMGLILPNGKGLGDAGSWTVQNSYCLLKEIEYLRKIPTFFFDVFFVGLNCIFLSKIDDKPRRKN